MILTAHQPAYFPWLGYFHKISLADQFILLDSVQFEKNSFVNRNKIKTSNGLAWHTIPIEMKGHMNKSILEVKIDEQSNWRRKHWNSLLMNYKKTPFFSRYADFFENYYTAVTTNSLIEFIAVSTDFFFKELNITIPKSKLSDLGIQSTKQDLIIDMCNLMKCDTFVFGALGKNYANKSFFDSHNISIYFQEYQHPSYTQLWGDFLPYMGVVDLLFNLGAERSKELITLNNISQKELKQILMK